MGEDSVCMTVTTSRDLGSDDLEPHLQGHGIRLNFSVDRETKCYPRGELLLIETLLCACSCPSCLNLWGHQLPIPACPLKHAQGQATP